MNYAVFRKSSGQILRTVVCDEVTLFLNIGDDEGAIGIGAEVTDQSHYIADGDSLVVMPVRMSPAHQFDWATKQWVDSRSLGDLRLARWEVIKTAREEAFNAPLITPYGVFDAYAEARNNISDAVLLANNLAALGHPVAIEFTLYDNSVVTLNAMAMVNVGLLLAGRAQLVRNKATALRVQIEISSAEALDSIVW